MFGGRGVIGITIVVGVMMMMMTIVFVSHRIVAVGILIGVWMAIIMLRFFRVHGSTWWYCGNGGGGGMMHRHILCMTGFEATT